jgi:hypothetical protein
MLERESSSREREKVWNSDLSDYQHTEEEKKEKESRQHAYYCSLTIGSMWYTLSQITPFFLLFFPFTVNLSLVD